MKSNAKFEKFVHKVIEEYSKILLLDQHTFELKAGVQNSDAAMECCFSYPLYREHSYKE